MSDEKEKRSSEDTILSTEPLSRLTIFNYGVGHMLNDITSACWFTYLLVFLTGVGFTPRDAATVMLFGQVADGFATIFVGELIDRFGHFKLWHAAGSLLVATSFSLVFGSCLPCTLLGDSPTIRTVGYSTFAAIFNVGWAATQVSHMAMVICLTLNATSRVVLTSCRNAFTMVANLSLYGIAFAVFNASDAKDPMDIENQYRWIAYISIFIGCCFVGIFLIGTKEPRLKHHNGRNNSKRIGWNHWFGKALYYQVALVYVLTRLVCNVSQALLAFYLINELQMGQSSKALIPAVIFISSFFVSVALQEVRWNGDRLKLFFSMGAIMWIFCGVGFLFLPRSMSNLMYPLSVIIGIANAFMTVVAISMESVLVGQDLNGCGFVYASLSFFDKVICGLALYALEFNQGHNIGHKNLLGIQRYEVNANVADIQGAASLTRYGIGLLPAICSLLGIMVTYTMDLSTRPPQPLLGPLLE